MAVRIPRQNIDARDADLARRCVKAGSGKYSAVVVINAANADPKAVTVPVTLDVRPRTNADLNVDTQLLSYVFAEGTEPAPRLVRLTNRGQGEIRYNVVSQRPGLVVATPASGSVTSDRPVDILVSLNTAGLRSGDAIRSVVTVSPASGPAITIAVQATVTAAKASLLISQTGLSFTTVAQGGAPLPDTITILNTGQRPLNWRAEPQTLTGPVGWLRVSSSAGTVNRPFVDVSTFDVEVRTDGCTEGEYQGLIRITSPDADNGNQVISVTLQVLPSGSDPGPQIRPSGVVLVSADGQNPPAALVRVANPSRREGRFVSQQITFDGKRWFAHFATSDTVRPEAPVTITIQPDFATLTPGIRYESITLQFEGRTRTVGVLSAVGERRTSVAKEALKADGCTPSS